MEKEYDLSMDWFLFGKGVMHYKKERQRVAPLEKELEVKQELRQLVEYMDRDRLLYHEVMAYFERSKRANRELVESPPAAPQS